MLKAARDLIHGFRERAEMRAADTVVVSYPKSGRTWLRLLVGRALATHYGLTEAVEADPDLLLRTERLARLGDGIPAIVFSHDDKPHAKPTAEIETDKSAFADRRVVFLVRDPRDVAVSQYFSLTKRTDGGGFSGTISDFVRDEQIGPANHIAYLNIWARAAEALPDVQVVSYEELHADTEGVLAGLLREAGAEGISHDVIAEAVAYGQFDNMRQMEAEGTFKSKMLRPSDPTDTDTFKTRSGKVGGYAEHLSPEDIATLDALIAERLDPSYGYGPSA